ncbi:serine hydrolase domain-containing protein [Roseicitreum antarcticum]|uniref:CubicO group peptidase, beta-lactamase class C family n=1 Tax=Roseicitreum antarcticum TaxID=564137 RepID=A0A1H3FH76_9RHOB|nr:serine hydrolase domain-containing protein [Roseicitreum antarcticum]SDX90483.1 CubicO group peptidase, beta-lactamase class C family [Roseicitreum antarcticum]
MQISLASISAALLLLAGADAAQSETLELAEFDALRAIAQDQFDSHKLNSLIYQVRIDGEDVLTEALGHAMTGVPATPDGQFRNGAVALAYVAAVALRLAEEGLLDLNEPIARWLPELPGGDTATVRMLADMTAGYPDHVANEAGFVEPFLANPFLEWTPDELIAVSLSTPRLFEPGTNWDYSHSGYVILGQVLQAATGQPLHDMMEQYVLGPLELTRTFGFDTAEIPGSVIHGFTGERGVWEDATFWNPSWTLPSGAIQVTTISDMARSFDAIVGHDGFLSSQSREQMITPFLIGFGAPLPGCPSCHEMTEEFSYGLGVMLQGDWVFQTPSFGGYASSVGTLPEERSDKGRITIAVAVTYTAASTQDWTIGPANRADETARLMAALIHPQNRPPMR